ncbi:transposase [Candidatus Darwinibacter acetoxidans]|jgi:transposase-like protein
MASVNPPAGVVKLYALIAETIRCGQAASVAARARMLQLRVNAIAAREAGRYPREPRPPEDGPLSEWCCSRCGSRRKCDFNYSGSYMRTVVFEDGDAVLRIPRLRCRCGGNVPGDFEPMLCRYQRHWYDLMLAAVGLIVEGMSLRAARRHFARLGVYVGLSSLARAVGRFEDVDINAEIGKRMVEALSLDAAFWRVEGDSRAHLYAHEVRERDEPLVRDGREVAWHQTGKVLGIGLAMDETQQAWQDLLADMVSAGVVDSSAELFVTSDGNQGLLSAVEMELPWAVLQRCVWHIGYRTRSKIVNAKHRDALERDALWVFNADSVEAARGRLGRFMARWREREPEAAASVGRKFMQGVEYLRHPERKVRPRTAAISERYNQEAKRRFRPGRSFGSERNLRAMTRLLALRHNCIIDRTDWLEHAARWRWDQPVPLTTAYQHESRPAPLYTNGGT